MHEMLPSVIIFAICYILIISEKISKTVIVLMGTAVAVMREQITCKDAFDKVDLNVVFLLLGMMMIVNILSKSGVFEWCAIVLAKKANGNGLIIVIGFVLLTAFLSAILDNVTTVILIAPITILITQIMEIPTVPVLTLEAIFSNIGGTATLVGDPPNILIGSKTSLTFNDFLFNLAPLIGIVILACLVMVFFHFRKKIHKNEKARELIRKSDPRLAIVDIKILQRGLPVFGAVIIGFFAESLLKIEPGLVALVGAFMMAVICKVDIHEVVGKVEWETILFFVGLFMLVGILEVNGVFEFLGEKIITLTAHHLLLTTLVILWVSAIGSAVVDNIPLVIAMIPLIKGIIPSFATDLGIQNMPGVIHNQVEQPLFWALALGACLGGNGSLVGASANVVVSQIARRNDYQMTFMSFTRYGIVFTFVSLTLSTAYIYLRYFAMGG